MAHIFVDILIKTLYVSIIFSVYTYNVIILQVCSISKSINIPSLKVRTYSEISFKDYSKITLKSITYKTIIFVRDSSMYNYKVFIKLKTKSTMSIFTHWILSATGF